MEECLPLYGRNHRWSQVWQTWGSGLTRAPTWRTSDRTIRFFIVPFQSNGNRQTSESDNQKVSIVFPLSFIFTSMLAMLMLIIFQLNWCDKCSDPEAVSARMQVQPREVQGEAGQLPPGEGGLAWMVWQVGKMTYVIHVACRKCILSGKKVGPLWTWSSRITKARSLFTSARLWRPGENREKHFFSVTNIYTLFNPFSVIIGNIKFSFQGRFVVLCSFGKINPSKVICSLSWHSWNRFDKYNWGFPIF